MSIKEAAAALGVTAQTIRNWINTKKIKAHKLGGLWRITEEEVEFVRVNGTRTTV